MKGKKRETLNTLLKEEIYPFFLENSFNVKRGFIYQLRKDFIIYISHELFRFNNPLSSSFWFNLGLASGDFRSKKNINSKLVLSEGISLFSERLGYLWDQKTHMYEVSQVNLVNIIKDDLGKYLFPFCTQFTVLDDVIRYLVEENKKLGMNKNSYRIATLLAGLNRKEEAKKYFAESVGDRETINRIALTYGIDIDK